MKTIVLTFILGLFLSNSANAQINKQQYKNRSEMMGLVKKLQDDKVSKTSRKQAKQMAKEGWLVAPGGLALEKQIENSALYQNSFEDDGVTPKFVWGDATSIGEHYDGAKMQALEIARMNLASNIESNITKLVEANNSNKQLVAEEAASVSKAITAAKSFVTQKLGQTIIVIETYRRLKNKNYEVRVQIFYSMEKGRALAKQGIREELEKQGDELLDEIDELLGF